MEEDKVCSMVLDRGIPVCVLGSVLACESVYQQVCTAYELTKGRLSVEVQKPIPIVYDELVFTA